MKQLVLEIFERSEQPLRPGDFVKNHGLEKKDVDKAIKELKVEGKIYSPKRCFYGIKK